MADIIEFGRKCQDLKSVKDQHLRQRKIEALKRMIQCTRCMMKCIKCGAPIESGDDAPHYASPYDFCADCAGEYEEYRERADGARSTPKYYWHNDAWMKVWESWLNHQQRLDHYKQSREFLKLVEEVEILLQQ